MRLNKKRKIMTVVSSKEFVNNQRKYYKMAVNERICIKRGKSRFHLINTIDDDEEDAALLALAESRRNSIDREFISIDEFISLLEK